MVQPCKAVFRIRGPVPLITDPYPDSDADPKPTYFFSTITNKMKKNEVFLQNFLEPFSVLTVGTFTSVFKNNKLSKSQNTGSGS
jgi:hypothetical protein